MLMLCYCLCICLFQDIHIIIIIIIRHQLDSDRPVWPRLLVSSKVFQDVFAHLVYNLIIIIFGILLLFIPTPCLSQFDMYLLHFWSTGSTLNSSRISAFLFVITKGENILLCVMCGVLMVNVCCTHHPSAPQ